MSLKRTQKSANSQSTGNNNIKRGKLLTRAENLNVTEWLKATETQAPAAVKTVTLQQRTAAGVLLLNCAEKSANITMEGRILHRTEQEVFARFEQQQQVGKIMTPDEICELARTIHNKLLVTEAKRRQIKTGVGPDGKEAIGSSFDAGEEWFQQFCQRCMPWRHLVDAKMKPIKKPENNTNLEAAKHNSIAMKNPSGDAKKPVSKIKQNLKQVHTVKTNNVAGKAKSVPKPSLTCKREARQFIRDFHEFITDGNYLPQQVFNAAEMFLNWKLMPQCTKLYKKDRFNSGGDRLSLLFCGNASGDFLVKPMYRHHTYSPKNQDESLLQLYIPKPRTNIGREHVRAEFFFEWLQNCFIPEVRDFLQVMDLPAKALLLIDAALLQGHIELPVSAEDNFVEFLYFPDMTASLLQPLSMTVMPTFACNYLRRLLSAMMAKNVVNYGLTFNVLWDNFAMVDSFLLIQQSIAEIKAVCWNSGWETIWNEIVREPFDQHLITAAIKSIAAIGRHIPQDGFTKMTSEDVEKHLKSNVSLLPAFQALSAGKNHLSWLDSDNDSDLDETVTDLDKNPFLLNKDIMDSEEDEDVKDISFDFVTVACNPLKENEFNSELNSPTSSSRLPSISDCETPATPEFDLSSCKSDLSLPALSESDMDVFDSECSTPQLSELDSQCEPELEAFKSEIKSCVVNKIDNLSQAMKRIPKKSDGVKAIRSLHEKLDVVVTELNDLKSQCVQIEKKTRQSPITLPIVTLFKKPFETAEAFRKFDEKLHNSSRLQEHLIRFFSSKLNDDTSIDKSIEKVWRSSVTDKAAFDLVWKGRRDNERTPVIDFKFSQLLKSLFIVKHKGHATDFDSICGKILNAAHDRVRKQQRYRREKAKS